MYFGNRNYESMRLSRTEEPSFHLTTRNTSQWAGDYTGAAAIEMDLNAIVVPIGDFPNANGMRIMSGPTNLNCRTTSGIMGIRGVSLRGGLSRHY